MNILLGFIPWIIYLFLISHNPQHINLAIIVAFVLTTVVEFNELRKGFVLAIGTFVYFIVMLIGVTILHNQWLMSYPFLLANTALAVIAWGSLIVKQPFTIQYAKEKISPDLWQQPLFIRINQILTTSWAIIFTLCVLVHLSQHLLHIAEDWVPATITNTLSILGVILTFKFPAWYKARKLELLKTKTAKSPFLQGNFKPISDELDCEDLKIIGEIPNDLHGVYMRNGPNPAFAPISYTYPFDGDGMLHAVYIQNGKARYKNKYVQTDGLSAEQKAGKALYGGIMHPIIPDAKYFPKEAKIEPYKNGAFINIVPFADQYLALFEGDYAYTVDRDLHTTGKWRPIDNQLLNVGPHPHSDPHTGEMWFINYEFDQPLLSLYGFAKDAQCIANYTVQLDHPTMVHDFVLTKDYAVIFLCPVIFNFEAAKKGEGVLQWRPELGVKIAVVARKTGQVQWFHTESFFVFHFANGYQDNDHLIIDYVKHSHFSTKDIDNQQKQLSLDRLTLNLSTGTINSHCYDQQHVIEFPRIAEQYTGQTYRYVYLPKKYNSTAFNCIAKYDMENNHCIEHKFGNNIEVGEAVFVPREQSTSEDDGYVLFFAYDKTSNNSRLVILDAQNLNADPIAEIIMPRRVPNGLHGNWFDGKEYSK